jgi:ADP-heptose:LPS heptosyltransferase
MAQTWRVTRAKVAAFRAIDTLSLPIRPFIRKRPAPQSIRSILVMEPWHIGDVVLATPALRALRDRYPDARISLLGKQHAEELLRHSGLVDEVIVFDIPWTAKESKYSPSRYDRHAIHDLIGTLRSRQFDLTVDARMDLRSNYLTWLTRAPRRVGYDFGGGSFLLTDAVPADPDTLHRVDDWLALMKPLGAFARFEPMLRVTPEETQAARDKLARHGIAKADRIVAIHGGASDERRRWPSDKFERVAGRLVEKYGVKVVWLFDPESPDREVPIASAVVRTSLREMMAIFSVCDVVICNDSGPMHIADALDRRVVAVFLTGNPVWHRPYRPNQEVVGEGTGHDFLVAPKEGEVVAAAERQLARAGVRPL